MLWRDAFGPRAPGASGAPARGAMAGETALDSTPRSATPPRRPPTPAAPTPGGPIWDYTPSPPVRAPSSRRIPALIGVLALGAIAVGAFRLLRPDDDGGKRAREAPAAPSPTPAAPAPPAPRSYTASVAVEPPTARIELDGAGAGQGRFERTFSADGADHTLVISAEGFETRTISFRDAPPPARITLVARPPRSSRSRRPRSPRRARAANGRREKRALRSREAPRRPVPESGRRAHRRLAFARSPPSLPARRSATIETALARGAILASRPGVPFRLRAFSGASAATLFRTAADAPEKAHARPAAPDRSGASATRVTRIACDQGRRRLFERRRSLRVEGGRPVTVTAPTV